MGERYSSPSSRILDDLRDPIQMRALYCKLALLCALHLGLNACQRSTSVSGVWREIEQEEFSPPQEGALTELYELNLGQYGERVAGVSVRYRRPTEASLALFDQADRCNCSFVVQGLIETLESEEDGQLLFVASGLTFSLYTPNSLDAQNERSDIEGSEKDTDLKCEQLPAECRRIFDLEQVERGEALEGTTWCLDAPEESRRPIRFEMINGIPENSCEVG